MIKTSAFPFSIAETHRLLREKQISPTELVRFYLDKIEKIDPQVKAWVRVEKDSALQRAKELEELHASTEEISPLFGIPYAAKDIFYTKGIPTEGGSKSLKGFIPNEDASVVQKLRDSGAILLGKVTTTEFANLGTPPETGNAWNVDHTPGGSSSGSAAAVAAGMSLMALGTQTAGSIARPAAYNGLTALKATYGRVSKAGVIPASWSLDHVGAFTKSVEDTVLVYNEISGPDQADSTTWTLPKQELLQRENKALTVGIVVDDYFADVDKEIDESLTTAIQVLKGLGIKTTLIKLPKSLIAANAAQHIVMKSETANYHAEAYQKDPLLYGEYLQLFIKEGLQIKANDYLKAQRIRSIFRQELSSLFQDVDVLVTPATPTPAPEGKAATGTPVYNLPFTNAGVPTLTLPIGFTKEKHLPMAMQLVAAPMKEQNLIDIGFLFQRETDWHLKVPEYQ